TGHTIVPLVWELSRIVGEPHGGWVHWGATTQNIIHAGDLLVLPQAHSVILGLIAEALAAAADLAEKGADMPIAGRTHGQHALPATFGYKAAVWIDELLRHTERLQQAAPRIFVAMLGGGAGTYASLGADGPRVQQGIARQLGFGSMVVPARTIGDHLAENICLLGLLAATCGKIGREIYTLMKTDLGKTIGRQHAHDVVYDAAQAAAVEGKPFAELLAADRRVSAHLDARAIAALLDPTAYTGLCAEMARDGAKRARARAKEIAGI